MRNNLVVEQFVERRIGLLGRHCVLDDRHHGGGKLDDNRVGASVRQVIACDVHIGSDIIEHLVEVGSPFKFHGHHGHIVLAVGSEFLEVVHRVEAVLHNLRHVGLHLTGRSSGIGGEDGDVWRVHFGELVDRQLCVAIDANDNYRDEDKRRGNGFGDRCFVYCHGSNGKLKIENEKWKIILLRGF